MPQEVINGIPVDFPFVPYDIQKSFMHSVIEALKTKKHAILESPTGTGKTLSLLCSTISWLKTSGVLTPSAPKSYNEDLQTSDSFENDNNRVWETRTRVFYTSRTHSQLSKAMTELKSTSYKDVKVTILGSRDQMCIHPEVSKQQSLNNKNLMCRMHIKAKSCHYGNRVESCKSHPTLAEGIVDIEDLITKSRKLSCCPYYMAKDMQESADIIFLPYNYIFDPHIRKNLNINLQNSVIILDEGHNINKVCEEAASVTLHSTDVALALTEVTQDMEAIYKAPEDYEIIERDYSPDDLCFIKESLLKLEKSIDNLELQNDSDNATHIGSYIFKIFKNADIDEYSCKKIVSLLNRIADCLSSVETSTGGRKGIALQKLADIITVIFSLSALDKSIADKYFKVYVESVVTKIPRLHTWDSLDVHANKNAKKINLWCFNAGYEMANLLLHSGIHSLILTSGTLAPLTATIRELNLQDPVSLESKHIIGPDQVLVNVICKGPTGVELRSSYLNRDNDQYWNEIGLCLRNYLRLIPDGVLVFFPSYSTLNKAVEQWKNSGLWVKLSSVKPIFIEPTRKNEFNEVMTEYTNSISNGNGRGALLLGVCRGKISEGLDFINEYGRAVIICGLPYPPLLDPRVKLKKVYLDQSDRTIRPLSGDSWYQLEATRAVNQAIGRVIRHSKDFGAILLCDVKFNQKSVIDNLSKWLQPLISNKSFGASISSIKKFFHNNCRVENSKSLEGKSPIMERNPTESPTSSNKHQQSTTMDFSQPSTSSHIPFIGEGTRNMEKKANGSSSVKFLKPISIFDSLETNDQHDKSENKETTRRKCSVFSEISEESVITPAKKRKIKIKPLVIDDFNGPSNDQSVSAYNTAKNFLCELKSILDEDSYRKYTVILREYYHSQNFESLVEKLCLLFPPSDPAFREIFMECKKVLVGRHLKMFEEYCTKL